MGAWEPREPREPWELFHRRCKPATMVLQAYKRQNLRPAFPCRMPSEELRQLQEPRSHGPREPRELWEPWELFH
jgi:hypothetical protein